MTQRKIATRSANNQITLEPVSEEVYTEMSQPTWRYQKAMQRKGLCKCPRKMLWACDEDCAICNYSTYSNQISLDAPIKGGNEDIALIDTMATASSPEEIVIARERSIQIKKALDALTPQEYCIIMSKCSTKSLRAAARKCNMAYSTFRRRLPKIQARLADALKEYKE